MARVLLVVLVLLVAPGRAGLAQTAASPMASPPAAAASEALRIGSKRFTESYILAEVLARTAAASTPVPPVLRQGLGNTAIVYEALRSGAIDG